ncbi:MAG TPA: TonB-dependent receptor [Bryobacteraceae bacterium]
MVRFATLVGVSCLLATGIWAQELSSITGTVTDPAGAAVPGANVEIKNTDTGFLYKSGASATGNYAVPVTVGNYEVSVTAPGFKKFVRSGVAVPAATDVRVDALLAVGAPNETVTVVATDAPLLKTESAEVAYNVTVDTLDSLPVTPINSGVVRSPYAMLNLAPGTNFINNSDFRVNGMPSNTESILIEGQDATNSQWQQQVSQVQMSVDAIQEIALQTSNYAPEFGQAGGGVVSIIMRSGTNSYHGSAYDFMTNEDLNAGEPYTSSAGTNPPVGHARPRSRLNDYGFTLGGPVRIPKVYDGHDRTFFFFNWEQLRNKAFNSTTYYTVPNAGLLAGNFALANQDLTVGSCTANCQLITTDPTGQNIYRGEIFDPNSEYMSGQYRIRNPFPNNIIPPSRFDPVALKIQALIPAPNETTYGGVDLNYLAPTYENTPHTTIPSFKIDHSFSSTIKLSIFYSLNKQTTENNNGIPGAGFNGVEPGNQRTHTVRINFDETIRPTLLLHVGIGDAHTVFINAPPAYNAATQLGFNGLESNYFPYLLGGFTGSGGLSGYSASPGSGLILYLTDEKPTANTYLTWVKGNHTFKFGGDLVVNSFPSVSSEYSNCWCEFSGNTTNAPYVNVNDLTAPYQAGSGYASFLLGAVNGGDFAPPADAHLGQHSIGVYAQDTWKVTRKLTLTYGLRYDYQTYLKEEHGRIASFSSSVFNPTVNRLGGVAFEGYGGPHCNCEYSSIYPFAFGPRLGVAYQINSKTVLRAGGGISYGKTAEDADFSYSIGSIIPFTTPTIDDPFFTLSQGIPAGFHTSYPNFNPGQFPTVINGVENIGSTPFFLIGPGAGRPPRIMQWSIGLQREIARNLIVEANYIGNRGAWWQAVPPLNLLPQSLLAKDGLSLATNGATLLPEPLSSSAVQAAGFGVPYNGFPTSASLAQSLLPFPQFQSGLAPSWAPLGDTWYDALQARVTKRYSHGLEISAQFAFQKSETLGAGNSQAFDALFAANGATPFNNIYNYKSNKELSLDDFPEQLVISGSYTTPKVGNGAGFNKILSQIVHNWRIAAVLRYQNGQLFTIPGTNNGLSSELPNTTTYATRVPGVPLFASGITPNCHCFNAQEQLVLNPAAFVQTPVGQFSPDSPIQSDFRWMREPAESMSLGRIFVFDKEGRYNLEFRAEFQNIFNRHFYSLPSDSSLTTPTSYGNGILTAGYGFIGTAAGAGDTPRSGQLVARFRF